jgi:peptide/nickel transport system ATP-binding protein
VTEKDSPGAGEYARTDRGPSAEPLVQISGLKMHFPAEHSLLRRLRRLPRDVVHAVDGVDLDVYRGESLALVGESGSGKSTLARCIVGLYQPTSGEVRYEGRVLPAKRSRSERRRIQMVFQDPYSSLNPRMTVGQVLRELLRVHRMVPANAIGDRSRELVSLVGLGPQALGAHPRQFSGGQRQRIGIARALALEPELLVADEPVSALDVSVQATVLNLLQDLQKRLGLTMLFIAHNLAVVRHVCDRVAVMYLGRIVELADTEELFANPRHPYTKALLKAIPRLVPGRTSEAAVPGDPPSPLEVPSGCRFHTRCPIAQPVCSERDPELLGDPSAVGHTAACHFAWTALPPAHVPEVVVEEEGGDPEP